MPPQNRFVAKDGGSDARRGSTPAVGQQPPLPSKISNRSQSLDELETKETDENISAATEGASDDNKPNASDEGQPKASKAKPPTRPQRGERAKSNDPANTNLVNKGFSLNDSETASIGSSTSLANAVSAQPNPSDDSSSLNLDDTKSCSTTCSQPESIGSHSSEKKNNLLNRYVKKVRSLIKK